MIRTQLGLGLLIVYGFGLPTADAVPIDYTINFTATSGNAPTSGSFTYDSISPEFTNFFVEWEGFSFDLTASANFPFSSPPACIGVLTNAAATFFVMEGGCGSSFWTASATDIDANFNMANQGSAPNHVWFDDVGLPNDPGRDLGGLGSFTIVTAVPEPASFTLCLSALLALAFVGRKRLAASRDSSN